MDFVAWEDRYDVGIKQIDEQHKRLVKFTNDLYNSCIQGQDEASETFRKTLKDVVEYVKVHFSTEEALMAEHGYPGYAEHKREHEGFVMKVLEQVSLFEGGKKFIPNQFVRYLRDWLLEHIAITDHRYCDFFHAKGVR
jgi:hemerythrin